METMMNQRKLLSQSTLASLLWVAITACLVATLPIPPPDLWDCNPIVVHERTMDCCLPTDVPHIKDFEFPDPSEPMRVRRNSAFLDKETEEKVNLAYERMRALPTTDPRSMWVQQNMHCAYCTEVYKQQNSTKKLEIHRNWLLLPFHRWYVYFHERILASLIDDPTFTVPYWSWDNQSTAHTPFPNSIPVYMTEMPAVYDVNRDPRHLPPNIPDLSWGPFFGDQVPEDTDVDKLRVINNAFLHESLVRGSALPFRFLGGLYRYDEDLPYDPSLFEVGPHASIHGWVGDNLHFPQGEDMAPSYTAARDPIFFQHHSNVDRLFMEWSNLGGRRGFPTDPDFLNASFFFYDEKGDLVRVTVAQSLDMDKLRYSYTPNENAWMEDVSIPLSTLEPSRPREDNHVARALSSVLSWLGYSSRSAGALRNDIPAVESLSSVRFSNSTFHSRVSRPHASLRAAGKVDDLEEVLTIEGIWIPSRKLVWFDIFINLPDADYKTPVYATEWCGRFNNGPHIDRAEYLDRKFRFGVTIGEKLKKLGLVDQSSLIVSLVPQGTFKHDRAVEIDTITITLE